MNKLYPLTLLLLLLSGTISAQCIAFVTSTTPASCNGNDGTATIGMDGGINPYTLNTSWASFPVTNNSITVNELAAGTYAFTITDAANCNEIVEVVIDETFGPTAQAFSDFNCFNEGCIEVIANGGTPPYTYNWDNGFPTTQSACNLPPGVYSITVTDNNGCSVEVFAIVDETPIPLVSITETPLSCSTAELTAENLNGLPNIIYQWSTGSTDQSIVVNAAGNYVVTVVDATTGCENLMEFFYDGVNSGYVPTISDISCNGANDGSILANVPNNFDPISISWTSDNGFTSSLLEIDGLEVGNYFLTLEFPDGCIEDLGPYAINEPAELEIELVSLSDVTCYGGSDGEINVDLSGGTSPFDYSWAASLPSSPNVTDLAAGVYSLTATDVNGCSVVEEFTISEPDQMQATILSSPESCLGDGYATVDNVVGGTDPYDFAWSTGGSGSILNNLIAGTYSLTITDSKGCTYSTEVIIDSPIDLAVSSTFTSCNTDDGTATAAILGGATMPTFAWSNGQTTATAIDLAPEWYSVTVTDEATDCQVHQNVQVLEDTICYVRISGYVYLDDVEQDCQMDAATLPAPYQQVQLSDGQITFTNVDGYYEFTTDAGNYEVSVQYASLYDDLCSDPIMVNASTWGEAYTGNDFYLKLTENSDLQLKVIKFNARPGFQQDVRICLMNVGAVPRSGTLSFVHPEIQEYISSSPADDTYDMTTQTATWEYVDIPPGAIWVYTAKLLTPIGTALGTELAYGFYTDPLDNDLTPENNNIECSIEVTGSYDPNDKAVAPAGIGEEGIISMADSLLSYTIRFQNTGTDTAFTVLLRDTLDSDLLVETVRPGPSSHPYSLTVKEGNILEFLFENILLPDSTVNEESSNGFVIFDVFIRDDAPYGTVVENTAGIYFDFNPPIITNTVVNTIQMINALPDVAENDIAMELQPNPSRDAAWLNFTLEKAERVDISLLSIRGEKIKMLMANEQKQAGAHRLDLADLDLAAGVYFIQVETRSGGSGVVKLVRL